jgi:hypothetical protein
MSWQTPLTTGKWGHSQNTVMLRSRNSAEFFAAAQAASLAGYAHFLMHGARESTLDVLLQFASEPPAPINDRFAIIWDQASDDIRLWIAQGLAERHFYDMRRWRMMQRDLGNRFVPAPPPMSYYQGAHLSAPGSLSAPACMQTRARPNPYTAQALCTGKLTWNDLDSDMQGQILRKVGLRFDYERISERQVPLELRPPLLPADRGNAWAGTTQRLVITRPRCNILGHGPDDTLTVSFSDLVDRNYYIFDHGGEYDLGYDRHAVCSAMDVKRTWTDVFKIRLVFIETWSEHQRNYALFFTRRGVDGNEEVIDTDFVLHTRENKEAFARKLVEELHLRHRIVAGCDEFTL